MFLRILPGAALVVALVLGAVAAHAHGGEDHGAPPAAAALLPAVTTAGAAGEGTVFQAVLLPVPKAGTTTLFLADADSNAPVADATIEVEAGGWQGQAASAGSPGVYTLAWLPPAEGADVTLIVAAAGRADLLLVQAVKPPAVNVAVPPPAIAHWTHWAGGAGIGVGLALVAFALSRRSRKAVAVLALTLVAATEARAHGGEDHGAPAAVAAAEPGAVLTMPKATQFLLGIRTTRIEPQEAADTMRVVGRVIPDPAGYARVQPSQPARVVAEVPLPVPGQVVKRGQVLATLEPTLTAIEKGDRRAALARIDSELAIQEREVPRLEALNSAIPFRTLETARIRLDQLRRERAQIAGTALGRELVVAPVDGVVADVHLVPGEVVTPDRVLVEILDPARLRIEAIVHDVALAGRITGASASTKLLPDSSFILTPLGISPRVDPTDQGVHAVFAVDPGQAPLLRVGLPVDVFLATGATRLRTAVPRDAITESGGRQVVFVRTAPELFEARPVIVHQVVGPLAEVHGVAAGERIVTQGIEQMKAAR